MPMTSLTTTATSPSTGQVCCRRPMSCIEVTSRGTTLVLQSCAACGRHVWQKDGQLADRGELLDGVKIFLEQPRLPTPRRSGKRR